MLVPSPLALKLRGNAGVLVQTPVQPLNLQSEGMSSFPAERRCSQRIRLQIPLFIRGVDAYGEEFLDLAKTLNISAVGAFIATPRSLKINDIVSVTVPAPPSSAAGLVPAGTPPIQCRVRRLQPAGDLHLVGVEFLKPLE